MHACLQLEEGFAAGSKSPKSMCRLPNLMSTCLAKHWNLFCVVQWLRIHLLTPEHQEAWVRSLGGEDPLEEEMATYFSILD